MTEDITTTNVALLLEEDPGLSGIYTYLINPPVYKNHSMDLRNLVYDADGLYIEFNLGS